MPTAHHSYAPSTLLFNVLALLVGAWLIDRLTARADNHGDIAEQVAHSVSGGIADAVEAVTHHLSTLTTTSITPPAVEAYEDTPQAEGGSDTLPWHLVPEYDPAGYMLDPTDAYMPDPTPGAENGTAMIEPGTDLLAEIAKMEQPLPGLSRIDYSGEVA